MLRRLPTGACRGQMTSPWGLGLWVCALRCPERGAGLMSHRPPCRHPTSDPHPQLSKALAQLLFCQALRWPKLALFRCTGLAGPHLTGHIRNPSIAIRSRSIASVLLQLCCSIGCGYGPGRPRSQRESPLAKCPGCCAELFVSVHPSARAGCKAAWSVQRGNKRLTKVFSRLFSLPPLPCFFAQTLARTRMPRALTALRIATTHPKQSKTRTPSVSKLISGEPWSSRSAPLSHWKHCNS